MQRASRPEIIGLALLAIALLALAVSLRAAQPGTLEFSADYIWPAGAGLAYIGLAFVLLGLTPRVIPLFAAMALTHLAAALVMGCAFSAIADKPAQLSADALLEGFVRYPPAVLMQMAFTIPFACIVVWPRLQQEPAGGPRQPDASHAATMHAPAEPARIVAEADDDDGETNGENAEGNGDAQTDE